MKSFVKPFGFLFPVALFLIKGGNGSSLAPDAEMLNTPDLDPAPQFSRPLEVLPAETLDQRHRELSFLYEVIGPFDENPWQNPGLLLAVSRGIVCVVDEPNGKEYLLFDLETTEKAVGVHYVPGGAVGPEVLVIFERRLARILTAGSWTPTFPPSGSLLEFPPSGPPQYGPTVGFEDAPLGVVRFGGSMGEIDGIPYLNVLLDGNVWGMMYLLSQEVWPLPPSTFTPNAVILSAVTIIKAFPPRLAFFGVLLLISDGAQSGVWLWNQFQVQRYIEFPIDPSVEGGMIRIIESDDLDSLYISNVSGIGQVSRWSINTENNIVQIDYVEDISVPTNPVDFVVINSNIVTRRITINGPRIKGDPHLTTWNGERGDFHGECDLKLLSGVLDNGESLDIHVRTKIDTDWSYIKTAAVKIGDDVLEIHSGGDHLLNGVVGAEVTSLGGHAVEHSGYYYNVHLGGTQAIKIKNLRLVSVDLINPQPRAFKRSVGLFGDFTTGQRLARDGETILEDWNDFGNEWQVLETEPMLFSSVEGPQHPALCIMPDPKVAKMERKRRHLRGLNRDAAERACAGVDAGDFDMCVEDVLATSDTHMADAY